VLPEIMRLTVRQLLTRGKMLVLVVLGALPPLLAFLYTLSASRLDPETFLVRAYTSLVLTVVVPVTALVFAAAALGSELGTTFDRRKLVLEDPIRELGTHTVPVHLARDVTTSLTVNVEAEE